MNRRKEKRIQWLIILASFIMIVIRFLLNEKGRVSPDSIRYMRTAHVFPIIDNTTTPLGYPLAIKLLTIFGLQEFWASKVIGILAFLFILFFAYKKKFYFKEAVVLVSLFSFVSLFSSTLSEALILPLVFVFLYVARNSIIGQYSTTQIVVSMSLCLILLFNVRYSALFFMGTVLLFGLFQWRKKYGKAFVISSLLGFSFVVLYKLLFINYFHAGYVDQFLEIGLHPTSKLIVELFQGLATSFNPFIHMASPTGGIVNYAIYGVGVLTLVFMFFLFKYNPLSETEKLMAWVGVLGVLCSFFIQYFYSVDVLDYRLLSPFILSIWLLFFKKIYAVLGRKIYFISFLSLASGMLFTWLSRGDYLENRKAISRFLEQENLQNGKILFYTSPDEKIPNQIQVAELISTVNPEVYISKNPKDTLKSNVLTASKVQQKIKIMKNKYQ